MSRYSSGRPSPSSDVPLSPAGCLVMAGIGIAVLALLGWLFAPLFHGIIFSAFYVALPMWTIVFLGAVGATFFALRDQPALATLWGALFVCLFLGVGAVSSVATQVKFLDRIEKENVSEAIPDTTNVRYVPFEVARAKGLNQTTESQINLGEPEPVQEGKELNWLIPREPNGMYNSWVNKQDGVLIIDPNQNADQISQPFKYGEGMMLNNNWMWQAHRKNYWSTKTNPYYVKNGDEILMLSPYVKWGFSFPVMIPRWGGVLVIHPDGKIEDLSPEEARNDSRFDGERLYPQSLARRGMNAWAYQNGVANALFRHRDQTEMPEIQYTANQPPYLLPTERGPAWVAGAEPHGSSYSVHTMFYVDAQTGVFRYREYGGDSSLIGPNRAINVVQSAFPNYQWKGGGEGSSGSKIIALEPRPVVVEGDLYWMITITNGQHSSISDTVMVEATGQNRVTSLSDYAEVQGFIDSPEVSDDAEDSSSGGSGSESSSGSGLSDEELVELLEEAARRLEEGQ